MKNQIRNKKYLGVNLIKEMKELNFEKYKTMMKETEDDIKEWKDIQKQML